MRTPFLSAILALGLALAGCSCKDNPPDALFQTSTIDALLAGVFDGDLSLGELLTHGDLGIGTFDALDGEMIVLDGTCYQVKSDGRVYRPDPTTLTPFAAVCRFRPEQRFPIETPANAAQIQSLLDRRAANPNLFYAIKITGHFNSVHTRSVPRQTRPYPTLKEATAKQPEFHIPPTRGTLVGFRSPTYAKGLNVPGYHLHFLSDDRTVGGHVLAYELASGQCEIEAFSRWTLQVPEKQAAFAESDLAPDRSHDLEQIEKARK
jgi:acetolactate decarboxylase